MTLPCIRELLSSLLFDLFITGCIIMSEMNGDGIKRRDFLKLIGAGAIAASFESCLSKEGDASISTKQEIPKDKMTYRIAPRTGDRISLLGYGCMRWPMRKRKNGRGDEIDQEEVNRLVDYAISQGLNYLDTSPAYCQGLSERATGIALKKYPRDKIYIATKLSNFASHTRKDSLDMYYQSFKELQTDYIDYYLLHSIGGGSGIKLLHERYIDNGVLDFLLK